MQTITAATRTSTTWAVLDRNKRVVVLLGGSDAAAEARSWLARGYRITQLADD